MVSVVSICNRALDKLGSESITSLGDNTAPARACNRLYDSLRDAVLRDHPWNCAITRTSLAKLSAAPAWGFANQFLWPADCLRVLSVDTDLAWKVESRKILTDAGSPLNIIYIKSVTDPSEFDGLFIEALASRLAVELAEPLTQSNTKKEAAWREYVEAKSMAKSGDAQEGTPDTLPEDEWINARA